MCWGTGPGSLRVVLNTPRLLARLLGQPSNWEGFVSAEGWRVGEPVNPREPRVSVPVVSVQT